jgi:hypothetical protein
LLFYLLGLIFDPDDEDGYTGSGQNNGIINKLKIKFVLATLKQLQLATLNIILPFVYTFRPLVSDCDK